MRGVRPPDMSVPAIESGAVMTTEETSMSFGWRVYGLGVMALGLVCLAWGDFDPGQPVPRGFPDRTAMAYAAAALMFVAGAAIEWRRAAAWGAAALTAYYLLIVVLLLNGRVVLAHYAEFGAYSGAAEQLAIAAGGLIVYASTARIDAVRAARLTRLVQLAFGSCALLFGARGCSARWLGVARAFMRKPFLFRPGEAGLIAWDVDRLVALSKPLKPELVPIAEIREVNEAFWGSMTCRDVAEHARLINKS